VATELLDWFRVAAKPSTRVAAGGENADGPLASPATDRPSESLPLVRHPAVGGPDASPRIDPVGRPMGAIGPGPYRGITTAR